MRDESKLDRIIEELGTMGGYRGKDHYVTVDIDIVQLYKGRDDADARMARYLVHELSDWRVKAGNLELYLERIKETLAKNGFKYVENWDGEDFSSLVKLEPGETPEGGATPKDGGRR